MNNNAELIGALRSLATFLEDRPEFPELDGHQVHFMRFFWKDEFLASVKHLGSCEKVSDGTYYFVKREFDAGICITFFTEHEGLCEKVKVGEKTIPAQEAKIVEIEAKSETVVPIYEWRCPDSILKEASTDVGISGE